MKRTLLLGTVIGAALLGSAAASNAVAYDRRDGVSEHPKSAYYRRRGVKPQVRGYVARRGGYSYSYANSINTYGSSRTLYGGTLLYRDTVEGAAVAWRPVRSRLLLQLGHYSATAANRLT